eukprot:Phypoly_transcript_10753.p1 GENE.Phypoly_transcript_10753~~Phypoly_transcript_10753.p1  ORF type:complete len:325 (+),score=28.04 Phypoly_transcript_10753:130-1104(+)
MLCFYYIFCRLMATGFDPLVSTALALYGVLGIACAASVVYSFRESDVRRYRTQQWFHLFLGSFVAIRLLWFALKAAGIDEVITFTLNRVGLTLYFTAFTLVLFYWVENYHKTYVSSHDFLPRFFWAFVGCNVVMYLYETIIISIFIAEYLSGNHAEEGNPVYEVSIYTIIVLSFVVSFTFFIYGFRLYFRYKFSQDFESSDSGRSMELIKIFLCTIIFCACFLVRGCAFLYRPITGTRMNEETFFAIGYFIPELIPSFVEFYVIRTIKQQDREQNHYIEALYQEEEDLRDPALPMDTFSPLAAHSITPTLASLSEKSLLLSKSP